MEIFIIREGRQAGPFSEPAVRAFLTEGTARPADMGWRKGMPEWRPLAEVLKPRTEEPGAAATPPAAAKIVAEETHIPAGNPSPSPRCGAISCPRSASTSRSSCNPRTKAA